MLYLTSFPMAIVPQLQLWHLYSWYPYSPWASCIHKCRRCTLPVARRRCCSFRSTFSYDIDHDSVVWIPCISTNSTIIYAPRVKSMSQYSSCVFSDHSIVFEPCFALKRRFIFAKEKHSLHICCPIWWLRELCGMKLNSHIYYRG